MPVDMTMNVLIVDDYKTMLRIIENLLIQIGFRNVFMERYKYDWHLEYLGDSKKTLTSDDTRFCRLRPHLQGPNTIR